MKRPPASCRPTRRRGGQERPPARPRGIRPHVAPRPGVDRQGPPCRGPPRSPRGGRVNRAGVVPDAPTVVPSGLSRRAVPSGHRAGTPQGAPGLIRRSSLEPNHPAPRGALRTDPSVAVPRGPEFPEPRSRRARTYPDANRGQGFFRFCGAGGRRPQHPVLARRSIAFPGLPITPLAGRSPAPSGLRLTRSRLRFGILPPLAAYAVSRGDGQPLAVGLGMGLHRVITP